MTKEELGITDAGEAYIDAIIAQGQRKRAQGQWYSGDGEYQVKIARAHVRVEGGVGDAEDLALVAEFPEG